MDTYNPHRDNQLVLGVEPATPHLPLQPEVTGRGLQHTHVVRLDSGFTQVGGAHASERRSTSLRWFLAVVFRRWQLMAMVALGVLAITAVAVICLPPHYRSEAKLLVRLGRESVVIDPTASIGQSAVPMEGRDKEINSEIELLKGRQLLEKAVTDVGANRLLSIKPGQPETPENVSKAITLVEKKLTIEAVPESNVLSIQFEANDPALARDLISRLIDSYLDARSAIYRGEGNLQFFEDQVAKAREEQGSIQQQIEALRDSSGVSDPTVQRAALIKRIDDLQQEIEKDNADRAAEAASVEAVTHAAGSADTDHERMTLIARQSLLASMVQSLTADRAKAEADLKNVNEVDVKMDKLQQEATLSASRVTQYAKAYEQARIDQEMGKQRLSNISVSEPPVLPLTPKAPTRGLLVLAGVFLALTLWLGSAVAAESMDHTIRTTEHLAALGLGQTVSIPVLSVPKAMVALDGRLKENAVSLSKVNGSASQTGEMNGNSWHSGSHSETAIVGMPIRPAEQMQLVPKMLEFVQAIVERIIPVGEGIAAPRLIGVIGARPRQGVSTIALHLALNLSKLLQAAQEESDSDDRVLLLDADTESCRASEMAGVVQAPSFGESPKKSDSTVASSGEIEDGRDRLDVLTAGLRPENRMLLAVQIPQLLRAISQRYRHVVIDLPPISEKQSSARFAAHCGAVIFVCKADEVRSETVQQSISRLREANANITVAVLNQRRYPIPEWIYRST